MNHDDLMDRINKSAFGTQPKKTPVWIDDLRGEIERADKRAGHYKFEATVKVATISRWFKRLFGKGEKL